MNVKLKYFGQISEITGIAEEYLNIETNISNVELGNVLITKYPKLKGSNYQFAINEVIVNKDLKLKENDMIAVLPPFSGG